MGTLIAAIIDKALGITAAILNRVWKSKDDPRNQLQKAKNENAKAIANGTAGERFDEELNRLHGKN